MIFIILSILLLVLLLYYPVHDLYLIYIKGMPPGPISLPLIGSLHLMSPSNPHLSVGKLYKEHGPIFSLRMGPFGRAVFLGSINIIDEMFSTPGAHNRPKLSFIDLINNGADGIGSCECGSDKWKFLVKTLHQGQSQFSNINLSKRVQPYLGQLMQRFERNVGLDYELRGDMVKSCSAIFSSLVYGIETDNLDSEDLQSRITYHKTVMTCLNPSHLYNILPILWKIPTALTKKVLLCIQRREDLMCKMLRSHMDQFDSELHNLMDIVAQTILHNTNTLELKGTDKHDLLLSIWMYYLAGCDTLVDTNLWIVKSLCINPDVQKQIQAELDEVLTDDDENILDKKPNLHYTRATILECLRLNSPAAMGIPHSSSKDIKLSNYNIPKDTLIMPTQWTVHHDETHWPDPFKLKPQRFLNEQGQLLPLNYIFKKMPFIPFSRGIRTCLGQYIALDILLMFVCKTLHTYTIQLSDKCTPDLKGTIVLNLRPNDFSVVLQKRG